MKQYLELLEKVWVTGETRKTRNAETRAIFGEVLKFNLQEGFPAVTTKQLYFKSMAAELAGFLRAETDASKMGSSIWVKNAEAWSGTTNMGQVYGYLWRKWSPLHDPLGKMRDQLMDAPASRRHVISAWDPSRLDKGCLPPCHYAFQFYVSNTGELSCMVHMRSVDCILGLPFDIASYALLTHILANETLLKPHMLTMTLGDTHIYTGHEQAYKKIIVREPLALPKLYLAPSASIDNFTPDMAMLLNYQHHEAVHAELFV